MFSDRRLVILRGGSPWGFRLAGGYFSPIYVAKVRQGSKAAFGGLATGDTILSVNGISPVGKSLREVNDVVDTVRNQLVLDVESSPYRGFSRVSLDSTENSSLSRQPSKIMDYSSYNSSRSQANYPMYSSTSGFHSYDNKNTNSNAFIRDQRYVDSYGRPMGNPSPAIYRTATVTPNSPSARSQGQSFAYYSTASNNFYDQPHSHLRPTVSSSGYISDSNDPRRSNMSMRSNQNQPSSYRPAPQYNGRLTVGNDTNYFSDSECVTSGPRYYKISRSSNNARRPSNVVLPIRSMTSKAYDPYNEPQSPKLPQQQQPVDVYLHQQPRYVPPTPLVLPSFDQRRKSDPTIDRELGAELLKSPIANKKRYADSSFFRTPFNTYPTIDEQKEMAKKIAAILEGGDPTQKGATKFEKQRQRAEKYTLEADPAVQTLNTSNYRPLRSLQSGDSMQPMYNQSDVPDCIKHSLKEARNINPLRYVGAPEEFKQVHMQEHVTHTNVSPQTAMSLVHDLNNNRGKGAAIFQKRKARSEKWVVDENNVKKSNYHPTPSYIGPNTQPWGQRASTTWSGDEEPYVGPTYSPVRPKLNLPAPAPAPAPVLEPLVTPSSMQKTPRFGDFNARPRGFGTWNTDVASRSPRGSIDSRRGMNLNIGPTIREGALDSYGTAGASSKAWPSGIHNQSLFSPNASQTNESFKYPSENLLSKWRNQEYSPWNQQSQQQTNSSQIEMTREGVDTIRQRLMQQNLSQIEQQNKQYGTSDKRVADENYSSTQGTTQKHFTDL